MARTGNQTVAVFNPDPPPAGMDQVQAEWVIRQLLRVSNSTSLVTETVITEIGDSDQIRQDLNAHVQNQTNPHATTHLLLPDKGVNDHAAIDAHIQNLSNPHAVTHPQLGQRYTADQHRIANITDLQDTLDAIDAELLRLEQVKLDIADALQIFSFAAYGSADCPVDTAFANLGAAWQDLDIFTQGAVTPRGIVLDLVSGHFSVTNEGVYSLSVVGSMEHNSSNSGRVFYLRLYNHTDGTAVGDGIVIGTGRNAEATTIPINFLAEIGPTGVNKDFGFQIGNGDAYSAVNFQTCSYSINAEGEWRGLV